MTENFEEEFDGIDELEEEITETPKVASSRSTKQAPSRPAPQQKVAKESPGMPQAKPKMDKYVPLISPKRYVMFDTETQQSLMEDEDPMQLIIQLQAKILTEIEEIKKVV